MCIQVESKYRCIYILALYMLQRCIHIYVYIYFSVIYVSIYVCIYISVLYMLVLCMFGVIYVSGDMSGHVLKLRVRPHPSSLQICKS